MLWLDIRQHWPRYDVNQVLENIDMNQDIEKFVSVANGLAQSDYRKFIDYCNGTKFESPLLLTGDPFSVEYRSSVLANYRECAGVDEYQPQAHELSRFYDVAAPLTRQFPFSTGDLVTIGRYLAGLGYLMSHIALPRGATIVEFGAGWGHLALMLGRAGMRVACVDIDPTFVELINRAAMLESLEVTAFLGEFGDWPPEIAAADAVVFFEAFHHSLNHVAVVQRVFEMLKPGCHLFLCGEPIYPWFEVPWGLRMDGHSVWAVRNFKWMELGFSDDYAICLLIRCGFVVQKIVNEGIGPLGVIFRALKPAGVVCLADTLLPASEDASLLPRAEETYRYCGRDTVISIADLANWRTIQIALHNYLPRQLKIVFSLGAVTRDIIVPGNSDHMVELPIVRAAGQLRIQSETSCPADLNVNDDRRQLGIAIESLQYC